MSSCSKRVLLNRVTGWKFKRLKRKTILKVPSFWTIVTNHYICTTTEMSSKYPASITLISVWFTVWSRGIRCAYWDHEEKKRKVYFMTHSFFSQGMGLLQSKFSRFQCERFWQLMDWWNLYFLCQMQVPLRSRRMVKYKRFIVKASLEDTIISSSKGL